MNLDSVDLFWQALAGLIVVVGPWKAGIVFAERTGPLARPDRLRTALYTVAIATVAGLVFIIVGEPLVDLFHISEGAFLIGAGLIVVVFSISLVISDERPDDPGGEASKDSGEALRLAVYPLSVPLVITPPGIASLIALGVLAHVNDESLFAIIAAFIVVMGINLVVFLIESRYEQVLHPAVYQVAGRLLGVLLVAFGVSIGLDGLAQLKIIDL
jgi:multiple antibiotic resistance protein